MPEVTESQSTSQTATSGGKMSCKTLKKLCLVSELKPARSNYNGNKMQMRSFEVTHNFVAILSLILHFCLDDPNWNRASRPPGLLARLTTQKKMNMDPCKWLTQYEMCCNF